MKDAGMLVERARLIELFPDTGCRLILFVQFNLLPVGTQCSQ